MRFLGIDPGTGITGFGVVDYHKGKHTMVDAGVIRTKAHTPMEERLEIIYDNMNEVIDEFKPQVMSIEKIFFAKNVTTGISVSQARGVVLLAAQKHKMQIYEYTPLQIKMAVTGYGKAEKKQVQEMVRVMLNLKAAPKPDDCADALAAVLCHTATLTTATPQI